VSFGVSLKIKNSFFDRQAVMSGVSRAKRRNLSKAGAFIRRNAQWSMRRRKKPSPPGEPPHVHVGHLKRLILFGYDAVHGSVVVGPLRFKNGEAPALNEFGGTAQRKIRVIRFDRAAGRRRVKFKHVTARYPKRPFMGPALLKALPTIPRTWAGSVRT
jgi:hypothetical protein